MKKVNIMSENPGKIACEQAIKMILEYLDNELPDHNHAEMDLHLKTCRSCLSRLEFEKMLKSKVSALSEQKVPESLRNRIKKVTGEF